LEKLFTATYPNFPLRNTDQIFNQYSSDVRSYNFRLNYHIDEHGDTFIERNDKSNYKFRVLNRNFLRVLTTTPKAESDFYVFRGAHEREGYDPMKIISGKVTTEKIFSSISTTIFSNFALSWSGNRSCCLYLIKIPKDENYLILYNVFNNNSQGELEPNPNSQYEVALAPGKITFVSVNKINFNGKQMILFVCEYKSFTKQEFSDGFYEKIFESKYNKRYSIKYT
jgi:hypothetical protein